ncbi:MAG TPA: hypothetical protein VFN35_22195 [Ktedonobacteraceae bacterium]|nr:hypothetical protein [Ktedonobacteraceae bacterium]
MLCPYGPEPSPILRRPLLALIENPAHLSPTSKQRVNGWHPRLMGEHARHSS